MFIDYLAFLFLWKCDQCTNQWKPFRFSYHQLTRRYLCPTKYCWIEDNSGKFVKTLLAYANKRKQHLNIWETSTNAAGSMYNSVDATTGATQSSHDTRTCTWNGTDSNKKIVADGDYMLRMELTDKNGTGNVASFAFTKGPTAQKHTPASVPSFSSVSLNWSASVTGISPEITPSSNYVVYPNPGTGHFTVSGDDIQSLKVMNLAGNVVCTSQTPTFDITAQPRGIYLVTIITAQTTIAKKIIKE